MGAGSAGDHPPARLGAGRDGPAGSGIRGEAARSAAGLVRDRGARSRVRRRRGAQADYLAEDARTGEVLGALLVTRHWPESAEIHLLAVDPAHHRKGIGRPPERFEADMRADGDRLLEVKTQGPSLPDPDDAATLAILPRDGLPAAGGVARVLAENPA